MPNRQDSNLTSLYFAEEESIQTLPGSPVFHQLDPNTIGDVGVKIKRIARSTINGSRQNQRGEIVDQDVMINFGMDLTKHNTQRLLQSFLFAAAREKMSTAPLNGTAIAITGVVAATDDYTATSGLDGFIANQLVLASGFDTAANNGLKTVSAAASGALTVSEALVDETPSGTPVLQSVGYQFASGDVDVVVNSDSVDLTTTTADFTTMDLNVGEWIFVGGDLAANQFVSNSPGYARIKSISANLLKLSQTTWTPANETGTGLTIQIFFGNIIRNEKALANIVRRWLQFELGLGQDDDGTQYQYVEGCLGSEIAINVTKTSKIEMDLSFMGIDVSFRDGSTGAKSGTRVDLPYGSRALNTSQDIYRAYIGVVTGALNPDSLFGYVNEAKISINNNLTGDRALGYKGAFDFTAGNIDVGGSIDAYFATNPAIESVVADSDAEFNIISAKANTGFVFDMPLIELGDGAPKIQKDQPISVNLEKSAVECEDGYTFLFTQFGYLPDAAMPA